MKWYNPQFIGCDKEEGYIFLTVRLFVFICCMFGFKINKENACRFGPGFQSQ